MRNAIVWQFSKAEWDWLCAKAQFGALIESVHTPEDMIVAVLVGRRLLPDAVRESHTEVCPGSAHGLVPRELRTIEN